MTTPIDVTHGRARLEGGTITDHTGKDLTGVTFQMALGTSLKDAPTTGWVAPTITTVGPGTTLTDGTVIPGTSQRILKLLIGPPTPPGKWYLWWSYVDNPENDAVVFPWLVTTV